MCYKVSSTNSDVRGCPIALNSLACLFSMRADRVQTEIVCLSVTDIYFTSSIVSDDKPWEYVPLFDWIMECAQLS